MVDTLMEEAESMVAEESVDKASACSRKEILPAFCITVVSAIALYALMTFIQPMLINNDFI
ncbi:MAG: hypothetical protein VB027_06665 [Gordonibacter sp.]|nr:hypothetical protein [Gordonibacter sp.]